METRATKESGEVRIKYSLFGLQLGYAAYSKCEPSMNMQGMNTFKKRLQTFNYTKVWKITSSKVAKRTHLFQQQLH